MKTKDQEIMRLLKINLDQVTQILLILKNMELGILGVVVDSQLGKLLVE